MSPVHVDVTCRKCGSSRRLDVGSPSAGQSMQEYLHLVRERLEHKPSFSCFGGHTELRPPVPEFWDIRWETLSE
ncbi:MAG TPA: hypothetical protein VJ829_04460 [Candidatus Binatia bacterium]|nr:hypothetical protein [Candidatus Binatia bacterium]